MLSNDAGAVPYWRLSGFYFFYFSLLGVIVPFWGLYLQSLSFSVEEIGIVSAILMLTRVIAPNVWGWLSERTGRRLSVIRLGAFLACLCFSALLWQREFIWVSVAVACFSFFWNAILAQFEVLTLNHLGGHSHYYSRVRLWGSVGFILIVVALGLLFQRHSISLLPVVALVFLCLIWLSSLMVPEVQKPSIAEGHRDNFWRLIHSKQIICFLLAVFFLQVSHGSYYTFYSVYLDSLSYSRSLIGALWGLGVVAEVVVFWYMHQLMRVMGPRNIMLMTLAFTVIRWLLIGYFAESLAVILFAQLLHAFSFGTAHAVSIELVRRYFSNSHQGQGQALLSAVSFGAGGGCGALLSGFVWGYSPTLSFVLSAAMAAIAFVIVWWGLRDPQSRQVV